MVSNPARGACSAGAATAATPTPVATLTANPPEISRGQTSRLFWSTSTPTPARSTSQRRNAHQRYGNERHRHHLAAPNHNNLPPHMHKRHSTCRKRSDSDCGIMWYGIVMPTTDDIRKIAAPILKKQAFARPVFSGRPRAEMYMPRATLTFLSSRRSHSVSLIWFMSKTNWKTLFQRKVDVIDYRSIKSRMRGSILEDEIAILEKGSVGLYR